MTKFNRNFQNLTDLERFAVRFRQLDCSVKLPRSLSAAQLLRKIPQENKFSGSATLYSLPTVKSTKKLLPFVAAFAFVILISLVFSRMSLGIDSDVSGGRFLPISTLDFFGGIDEYDIVWYEPTEIIRHDFLPDNASDAVAPRSFAALKPAPAAISAKAALPQASEAMGGAGWSALLGEEGEFTYSYRKNDLSDPYFSDFPVTLFVVHKSSGVRAFEINIPDMLSVDKFFIADNLIILAGISAAPGETTIRAYDISNIGHEKEVFVRSSSGFLLGAAFTENSLNWYTRSPKVSPDTPEIAMLPGAAPDSYFIACHADFSDGSTTFATYSGFPKDGNFSLSDEGVRLDYAAPVTEDNPDAAYAVRIVWNEEFLLDVL